MSRLQGCKGWHGCCLVAVNVQCVGYSLLLNKLCCSPNPKFPCHTSASGQGFKESFCGIENGCTRFPVVAKCRYVYLSIAFLLGINPAFTCILSKSKACISVSLSVA